MERYCRCLAAGGLAVCFLSVATNVLFARVYWRVPDLDSREYWDTHDIAVVEVTSVKPVPDNEPAVGIKTVTVLTANPRNELNTLPAKTWYVPTGFIPNLFVGQHLLLCLPRPEAKDYTPLPMVVAFNEGGKPAPPSRSREGFAGGPGPQPPPSTFTLKASEAIASIRKLPSAQDGLSEAVASGEPLAIQYVIKWLGETNKPADVAKAVASLEKLRKDEDTHVEVRILASQTLNALLKKDQRTSDYWEWTRSAIENSKKMGLADLKILVLSLVQHSDTRAETGTFLMKVAQDTEQRIPVRIAARQGLIWNPFFKNRDLHDPWDNKAFDMLPSLLKDKNPEIRTDAASGLWEVVAGMPPPARVPRQDFIKRAQKAISALKDAVAVEADDAVKKEMLVYLQRIEIIEKMEQGKKDTSSATESGPSE